MNYVTDIPCTCGRGNRVPVAGHGLDCAITRAWEHAEEERIADLRYEARQKYQEKDL